ncbi:MAG: MFS transporter [Defluviitaleaceae bacterium]|nr:MFS transporter [Defluviitaleaceae bacterium]
MYLLLITIIYFSFISLGLGDSLFGSAWPVIQRDMGVPIHYAGIVSMTISGGTIFAGIISDRVTRKFGVRVVVPISVFMTAIALFGFSASTAFWMLCLWAIPYGLGGGTLDAAINNYVATHYTSRHMSWLHCFWGVGAMTGPYIMGIHLVWGIEWSGAYRTIAIAQIIFALVLVASFSLWKKREESSENNSPAKGLGEILRIPGVKFALLAFFAYCAVEATTGLWASTFLVNHRGIEAETAALFASLFFMGITVGRFVAGFVANKLGSMKMIKIGVCIIFIGIFSILVPINSDLFSFAGLIIIGLGCAPIFPALIHSTPSNFGAENSQSIIGVQMAGAYTGSALMPPLFGLMTNVVGLGFYPVFLMAFAVLLVAMLALLYMPRNCPKII